MEHLGYRYSHDIPMIYTAIYLYLYTVSIGYYRIWYLSKPSRFASRQCTAQVAKLLLQAKADPYAQETPEPLELCKIASLG